MRLIKMFGLATVAAVAAMAFVGATSASAETSTQLCDAHTGLTCSDAASDVHMVLAPGTVLKLLSPLVTVLCLGELWESSGADVGALGNPQSLDLTSKVSTGCGTTSAHSNCTLTTLTLPDADLLKLGLDEGSLELLSGTFRLQGCGFGLNCEYDLEGTLVSVGAQHVTMEETPVTELGGKFFCPDETKLDGLLETLDDRFVLQ